MWRLVIAAVVVILICIAGNVGAESRVGVQGDNIYLDGKPYFPFGMVTHCDPAEFPTLKSYGINSVTTEPLFSHFDPDATAVQRAQRFSYVQKNLDAAQANGQTAIMLFSMHYVPDWLFTKYPDAKMKKFDGSDGTGGWHPYCYDHPGVRDMMKQFIESTIADYKTHPALLGYILWNEPHMYGDVCYCKYHLDAFRQWLQARYSTIAALNSAWGTAYTDFTQPQAPPDRSGAYWFKRFDFQAEMLKGGGANATSPILRQAQDDGNSVVWDDWMRFRQEDYAAFFEWEADVVKAADPGRPVTTKAVSFEIYTSHAYGAAINTRKWSRDFCDVVGFDSYSHLDETFNNRWKADFMRDMAEGKPVWDTEASFTFLETRGRPSPETHRSSFWMQFARGVKGRWFFFWSPDQDAVWRFTYPDKTVEPGMDVLKDIAGQLGKHKDILSAARQTQAQVAFLHSTSTGLHQSGDYAPSADSTTILQCLYDQHIPFQFVTEQDIDDGILTKKRFRALITVGTLNAGDSLLGRIKQYVDEGGYVLANARFAQYDEKGKERAVYPPSWLGVRATKWYRTPREKTSMLSLKRKAVDIFKKTIDVNVELQGYDSKPMKATKQSLKLGLAPGTMFGSGNLFGNEDMQLPWSSGDRHEQTWEEVQPLAGSEVVARFSDGKPAIVTTDRTMYIARDTCWLDGKFRSAIARFMKNAGVVQEAYARDSQGKEVAPIDLVLCETPESWVLYATNSPRTLYYDGSPLRNVRVALPSFGDPVELLSGKTLRSVKYGDLREVILDFKEGEAKILVGKKLGQGWKNELDRFNDLKDWIAAPKPTVKAYRRSPTQLWVYDARPEMGMGMHGLPPKQLDMVRELGMRFVRHTMYWGTIENTEKPGVYNPQQIKYWDDVTKLAKEKDIELLVCVHQNAPGVNWDNRHAGFRRFARFLSDMSKRYPSIRYWELWNEMDAGFTDLFGIGRPGLGGFEGGKTYAEMLKLAYPAIKTANPKAYVVMGGLASPEGFARGIYEGGGRDYFDIMNLHTYGVPISWAFAGRGYTLWDLMRQYGDQEKPIWNTEFGIDAGNIVNAHGFPHASGGNDGESFDSGQLSAWKSCVELAQKLDLYQKYLPYQFSADNESGPPELKTTEYAEKYLPKGMTINDYGFGIVRTDGITPRPTYDWLQEHQPNKAINTKPIRTVDVTIDYDGYIPANYKHLIKANKLTIKAVKLDSLYPTKIAMVKAR